MLRRLSAATAIVLLVGACSSSTSGGGDGFEVVATIAPVADIVRAIGGDTFTVTTLAPPGAEAHEFEPGPREVEAITRADLVLYMSGPFQPAVERAVRARPAEARHDLLENTPTVEEAHLWLDLEQMRVWTREIRDRLIALAPEQRAAISEKAGTYVEELLALDDAYKTGLRECTHRTFVVTHDAFTELAARYELTQESLAGFEPEAEPDPVALENIVRVVKRLGLTTVFTEPGAPQRVIDTLVRETGAKAATLDPLEATVENSADTYVARMRANLDALREALGCR